MLDILPSIEMKTLAAIFAVLVVIVSVAVAEPVKKSGKSKKAPDTFADQLGKEVTLIGVAQDLKLGTQIQGKGFRIWIDGLRSWPEEFAWKEVSVTGVVIERYDLPVYILHPGAVPRAAMACPPGTDLRKASHRYLLKDAKWELHEPKNVFAAQLGKQITLIGVAEDHKIGAFLSGKDFGISIDVIHRWPEEFEGKQVSVTGIVIERFDLPVFIQRRNDPGIQGIPVPPGTDLRKASHRYLLKDAKWKLHEPQH